MMIPFLGLTDFNTKGEPREAVVAYTMLEHGNWILPINNGGNIPYKPPFFHWCIAFFSLNFYLGDKIQQFDKVLPQDGVLMIPEEDMPDFLEKFGKDYTFQKVWEVRKTVEWHNKVGFYRFVKTSANIALNK